MNITTEDGQQVAVGELAYNYYADYLDEFGIVRLESVEDLGAEHGVWGRWTQVNPREGSQLKPFLDGSRVCSLSYANLQGWVSHAAVQRALGVGSHTVGSNVVHTAVVHIGISAGHDDLDVGADICAHELVEAINDVIGEGYHAHLIDVLDGDHVYIPRD